MAAAALGIIILSQRALSQGSPHFGEGATGVAARLWWDERNQCQGELGNLCNFMGMLRCSCSELYEFCWQHCSNVALKAHSALPEQPTVEMLQASFLTSPSRHGS